MSRNQERQERSATARLMGLMRGHVNAKSLLGRAMARLDAVDMAAWTFELRWRLSQAWLALDAQGRKAALGWGPTEPTPVLEKLLASRPPKRRSPSDAWGLWRFLHEDGSSGYLVTTTGGGFPNVIAAFPGLTPRALKAAIKVRAQGNAAKGRMNWRMFVGAVLLPVDARGHVIGHDGVWACGEYRAEGLFALGTHEAKERRCKERGDVGAGGVSSMVLA